jgi:LPXTG-motif cell wall-anchored protein
VEPVPNLQLHFGGGVTATDDGRPVHVAAGQSFTVTGGGLRPGSTVTITLHSTPKTVGRATVGANGRFSADVHLPPDTTGQHQMVATGTAADGSPVRSSVPFVISETLPVTGTPAAPLATIGVITLLLGAIALISARRHKLRSRTA